MLNHLPLPLFLFGLVVLYVGERTLAGTARGVFAALAGLVLLGALGIACVRWLQSQAERRRAYGWVFGGYCTALAAVGLYGVQLSEVLADRGSWPTLVQVVWPGLLFLGLLPTVAMELAIGGMVRTPTLEIWRVRLASRSARIVGLALVTFAAVNFIANTWNRKIDLSYFKTTQVGSSTKAIAINLTKPVKFVLFFPPGNEVLEQVKGYVDELARESKEISVEVLDQAVEPERARELKVRSNGYIALQSGSTMESLRVDLDAEDARVTLRNLDSEIQQRLLRAIKPQRVAYFTTGHFERDYAPPANDKRPGVSDFKSLLESQGFTVRRLGLAEGLGREIPKDATVVFVLGPTENFTDAERNAMQRYLDGGGRAFFALDPDHGVTEDELLASLGVKVSKTLVANSRYLVRLEKQGESPYNLVTTRASTHPVGATLEQNPGRMFLALLGAGAVSKVEPVPPGTNVSFAVHAMPDSWEDKNGNAKLDEGSESRGNFELVAAIERAVVTPTGEAASAADKDKDAKDKADGKAADKNAKDKADKGPGKAADKDADKATDNAANKAGDKSTDKAEKTTDKTGDKSADKASDNSAGKDADKTEKTADKTGDKSADKASDNSAGKGADKAEKTADKTGDKSADKAGDKNDEKPAPMRAVVMGDADFATNGVVRNPGNAYFVLDALRWLAGDEQNAGTIASEVDVPLVHRKDEDALWFYGTSFLFPAAVLIGGLTYTRRTTRPRRKR